MNEHLRDRILRRLESLSDERGYQVLDYAEFLESRYAERQSSAGSTFTRFTEAIEDRLRAGKVSAGAIAETMGLMNRAANVLNGALAATRSMANDLVNAPSPGARPPGVSTSTGEQPISEARPATGVAPTVGGVAPGASSPAQDIKAPGSGQEKL